MHGGKKKHTFISVTLRSVNIHENFTEVLTINIFEHQFQVHNKYCSKHMQVWILGYHEGQLRDKLLLSTNPTPVHPSIEGLHIGEGSQQTFPLWLSMFV